MKYNKEDLKLLAIEGWVFGGEDYIYIPNDEDGCMADGEVHVRYVIESIRRRYQQKNEILE
jgi:hypothetical protein